MFVELGEDVGMSVENLCRTTRIGEWKSIRQAVIKKVCQKERRHARKRKSLTVATNIMEMENR